LGCGTTQLYERIGLRVEPISIDNGNQRSGATWSVNDGYGASCTTDCIMTVPPGGAGTKYRMPVVFIVSNTAGCVNALPTQAEIDAQLDKMNDTELARAVKKLSVFARVSPEHKIRIVHALQQNEEIVAMVGDGVNDAPALKAAHVGISMGNGADIAIDVSDVVLLNERPQSIYEAYKLSHRTFRAVKENLGFSLLYNVVAVPLAVLGFVNPLVAALSMSLSSLIVVGNSLRIKTLKFKDT